MRFRIWKKKQIFKFLSRVSRKYFVEESIGKDVASSDSDRCV